eukprot:TRINITY_DN29666_c0_g1_i1.p1 TRINITY_DN29666_c0_g1~~TRINITY_DN29666_c0_g1_i1.p1  ORF type:complete len:435 (+),score=91.69 TRINITY_DN29666_c0_g1_i1:183-1487(+)
MAIHMSSQEAHTHAPEMLETLDIQADSSPEQEEYPKEAKDKDDAMSETKTLLPLQSCACDDNAEESSSDGSDVSSGIAETLRGGERYYATDVMLQTGKLVLRNTFLDFDDKDATLPAPRRRALSEYSGTLDLFAAGVFEVSYEDLTAPFFGAVFQGGGGFNKSVQRMQENDPEFQIEMEQDDHDKSSPSLTSKQPVSEKDKIWTDNQVGHWATDDAAYPEESWWEEPDSWHQQEDGTWAKLFWKPVMMPVEGMQSEPRAPPGKEIYKPAWQWGSMWPFNCAPTTLKLSGLPRDLQEAGLLGKLEELGFKGFYDFIAMPTNWRTGRNDGYAIINLTRHSHGILLATHMHNFKDWQHAQKEEEPSKGVAVTWNLPSQGLWDLIEVYRNDPAMHQSIDEYRPKLFSNGCRIDFPPPTRMWNRSSHRGARQRSCQDSA